MAYYIPVVDNLLDTITISTSFMAGTILITSWLKIDSPKLRWTHSKSWQVVVWLAQFKQEFDFFD